MINTLRVLFIGESGAEAVSAELRNGGYELFVERVAGSSQLVEALQRQWDVAISDFHAPGCGSLEALRIISESGADLPVIVISGNVDDADILAALKAGAADHLNSASLMRLNAAVARELRSARIRRDRTLIEEQSGQARKMQALARLAGGVAHDFNNLLTIITGYSDLLLTGQGLKDNDRSAIEQIRRSAERGGALTDQLLAFSRPQPLPARTVRVNELLMGMEETLHSLIGEGVELVTIAAASEDAVEANPGRLEQVIARLVVNAAEAMPDGGKIILGTGTVHLSQSFHASQVGVEPGHFVVIVIADSGRGMSKETQNHLFEPFFTTKKPGHGAGLGLATAYGIVRQIGGAILFESEPGKGAAASIYLPMAAHSKRPQPETGLPRVAPSGTETVLLLTDEARVGKFILDTLTEHGYTVLEAPGIEEAIRLCQSREGAIALAVINVVRSEVSDPELAGKLAAICPGMRVLYVAGSGETVGCQGVPQPGVEVLRKPFRPDTLLRKVREALDARSNAAKE